MTVGNETVHFRKDAKGLRGEKHHFASTTNVRLFISITISTDSTSSLAILYMGFDMNNRERKGL